jgi:hypothetical protein
MTMAKVDLSDQDLRLILQSLQHCLDTCKQKAKKGGGPCEDCDAATALRDRLEALAPKTTGVKP